MIYALVGNQNSGKTTLFNALTGSSQHVGNFPGVTVEQKYGIIKGTDYQVVDLPGIYSIRPYSNEEILTRDFILNNKPDAIINIVDAMNIERNLYLTLQLLELRIPTVIAINMMDEIRANNASVNIELLSELLGVAVVPISAIKEEGISELIQVVENTAKNKSIPKVYDFCKPGPVHRCIHAVSHIIEDHADKVGIASRFATIQVILNDQHIINLLQLNDNEIETIRHNIVEMETERGLDCEAAIADMRYKFIESVCSQTVLKPEKSKERERSINIDKILTHKYFAIPIFAVIITTIFWLTFGPIGKLLSDGFSSFIDKIIGVIGSLLASYGINEVVQGLIVDGILAGVGSVLSFLPMILLLFFFLSILEDTGYMARIAFVMDKLLRKIGLSGKSIVPFLIGFGCTVPAVMATRTLPSERDRKLTILLVPFMSCTAKIPIYAFFTNYFFVEHKALIMTGLYFGGIITAIITSIIFNKVAFKGNPIPFVMEMPNYRLPSLKSVALLMEEKAKDFIQRAFTIIVASTILVWILQSFDLRFNVVEDASLSILGSLGKVLEPAFRPLGFGDYRFVTALVTGLIAKETVVSTLEVLIPTGITTILTTASALSFLTFTLLYTPCFAAIASIKREVNSTIKTIGIIVFQIIVAWLISFLVYSVAGVLI
ncbi:MAG: ferrous iron transport protein B [Erysipelotrichia bacterium]|nr:ferrous iron transport protein B [Erysipelotrichia bacterium]